MNINLENVDWMATGFLVATIGLGLAMCALMWQAIVKSRQPQTTRNDQEREKRQLRILATVAGAGAVLIWLSVMGVSFIGLRGFAQDVMQWRHWTNVLVPLSLDGISVSFGAWAFVAVKRGRWPGRARNIVMASALMSALINFSHGREEWSLLAGAYLAFLSLAGMLMFHELMDQALSEHEADELALRSRQPRFGMRWLWAPVSTLAALRVWVVYPPAPATPATVQNALAHRERVAVWLNPQRKRRGIPPWLTETSPETETAPLPEDQRKPFRKINGNPSGNGNGKPRHLTAIVSGSPGTASEEDQQGSGNASEQDLRAEARKFFRAQRKAGVIVTGNDIAEVVRGYGGNISERTGRNWIKAWEAVPD